MWEFPLLCPTPKVMPRFSFGDVGEARWPLSHTWIDTSPILPDAAHDSRNQGRVVSLSVLSLLSACVPTLPAARGSSQLAASAESLGHGRRAQQQTGHLPAAHDL